uniref:DUF6741 domain-containing protein n=1 Tax=Mycena chlorophos TaxID=658473 RepID=A0ABQ0LRS0_MYCCL|nr:predicted protein [Mycena chlorophos]
MSRRGSMSYASQAPMTPMSMGMGTTNNFAAYGQDRGLGMEYGDQQGYSPPYHGQHGDGMYNDQGLDMPYGQHYGGGGQQFGQFGHQQPGLYQNNRYGHSYDDLALGRSDPYYDEDDLSMGMHNMQIGRPITPIGMQHGYSQHSMYPSRHRRHSLASVSYSALPPTYIDANSSLYPYRAPSSLHVKFKRKGSLMAGLSLEEAQSTRTKIGGNDQYTMEDLHATQRQIRLRVQWNGYSPLTYQVPLDYSHRHGHTVDMSVLCRRVARACDHYLQAYSIPISPRRITLHKLEEVQYGVWTPMLSTR